MNEEDWFKRGTKADDPALVEFEAAIRRRNVLVYLIGGLISLPIGAFFTVIGYWLGHAHRVATMGLTIFLMGVACIIQSWRLSHGAPMTAAEGEAPDPARTRKRVIKAFVGVAIAGSVTGAVLLAVGHARDSTALETTGIGLIIGALVCAVRAFPMRA